MKRSRPEKVSQSGSEHEEYLRRFNRDHFFSYVEGYVFNSLSDSGKFDAGLIEWFIVEYFERHIFQGQDVVYVPEFAEAIFDLLHKHQERLVSFVTTNSARKNAIFPEADQKKYATLLLPGFGNSTRSLTRTILEIEVMHRRRMNKWQNRLKRRFSGLRKRT